MADDAIQLPRALLEPLPWLVREHPERHRTARGTLIRETLVALSVGHPPILETVNRLRHIERLRAALITFTQAADTAAQELGLAHRRELRADDGLPLPTRLDVHQIITLAQLAPARLDALAVATAHLHVALTLPLADLAIRAAVERLPALRSTTAWLVPSLLRWWHVRLYETVFAVEATPEQEQSVVIRARGPGRRLHDNAPHDLNAVAYGVKAWWAVRVSDGISQRQAARRWHAALRDKAHREKFGAEANVADCGCLRAVREALRAVDQHLAA